MPEYIRTTSIENLRRLNFVFRRKVTARRLLAGLLLVGAAAFYLVPVPIAGFSQSGNAAGISNDRPNQLLMSMGSCASCHGSAVFLEAENPANRWKSAYQVWSSRDPHSRAYNTLFNRQSRQIVSAIVAGKNKYPSAIRQPSIGEVQYQSIINEHCIACHSSVPAEMSVEMIGQQTSARQKESTVNNNLFMASGVNCHSCHAVTEMNDPNGKSWIEAHTKESWNAPGLDKSSHGLQELSDLNKRAQTCIKCHVGSAGRDVNHDLIAAGHPRLQFDYPSHLARLPKHWNESETPAFYSTCWSIGQMETTAASLALLQFRAQSAAEGYGPWPEFAEYNCQNCHQGLVGGLYFSNRSAFDGNNGWLNWDSSVHSAIEKTDLDLIRDEMEKANPDIAAIIDLTSNWEPVLDDTVHLDRLYASIQFHPQMNLNETLHWYLAAQSCIADFLSEPGEQRDRVLNLMQELESVMAQLFRETGKKQLPGNALENMTKIMSDIRNIVLPILETQRHKARLKP